MAQWLQTALHFVVGTCPQGWEQPTTVTRGDLDPLSMLFRCPSFGRPFGPASTLDRHPDFKHPSHDDWALWLDSNDTPAWARDFLCFLPFEENGHVGRLLHRRVESAESLCYCRHLIRAEPRLHNGF